MLLIDVNLNTLIKIIQGDTTLLFYIEKGDFLDIYANVNQVMYRHRYIMTDRTNDMLKLEKYLHSALRVEKLEYVNEDMWRSLFLDMNKQLREINEKLDGITKQ